MNSRKQSRAQLPPVVVAALQHRTDKVNFFEEVVLVSAARHDDRATLEAVNWLFEAIGDASAEEKADAERATIAIKLWNALPATQTQAARRFVAHDETVNEPCNGPTLVETKRALLRKIGEAWRQEKDEAQAQWLFKNLFRCYTEMLLEGGEKSLQEQKKGLLEVFREVSDHTCPTHRLENAILWLIPGPLDWHTRLHTMEGRDRAEVAHLLALAVGRNLKDDEIRPCAMVLRHMHGASEGMAECVAAFASEIAALEKKVRALTEERIFRGSYFQTTWSYLGPHTAPRVAVTVEFDYFGGASTLQVESMIGAVEKWRKEHPYPVHLIVRRKNQEKPSTEKVFE